MALPRGLAVGKGSINPYLLGPSRGGAGCKLLRFSPVYKYREDWLGACLRVDRVIDVSLTTSVKNAAKWLWGLVYRRSARPRVSEG